MNTAELLTDAFGRIRGVVHDVVDGLTEDELAHRQTPEANSIAWLVWHLSRVQDDHVADAAGQSQVWPDFTRRFDLPFEESETGYGHDSAAVGAVRVPGELLLAYHDATHDRTIAYLSTEPDLDRVVDEGWDPPVTLGVRLVSVVSDDLQHAGQAAFLRGLLRS